MKLHHIATIVLAGWSLMLPPVARTLRLDLNHDLSKWNVHSTHATASECEREKVRLQDSVHETAVSRKPSSRRMGRPNLLAARYGSARCVSSDDPSLKSN
jgi:hypothetical protein